MYQYVLLYRIGQKEILLQHIKYCNQVLDALNRCDGDKDDFADATIDMCRESNSLSDYLEEDL